MSCWCAHALMLLILAAVFAAVNVDHGGIVEKEVLYGDVVYINKETREMGFAKVVETAEIYVDGPEGAEMPSLPFLRAGDLFKDDDDSLWEISRAIQVRKHHKYMGEDGGYEWTYSWEYHAIASQ